MLFLLFMLKIFLCESDEFESEPGFIVTKAKGRVVEGSIPKTFRMHENYAKFILAFGNLGIVPKKNKFKFLSFTRFTMKFNEFEIEDGTYDAILFASVRSAFIYVQPPVALNERCYTIPQFSNYEMITHFSVRVENNKFVSVVKK